MMINRIEVAIDRSLEKLHMDVKERRVPSISMGHDRKVFYVFTFPLSLLFDLSSRLKNGGHGQARTADLTIISRAL